jgi:hypothetical protein
LLEYKFGKYPKGIPLVVSETSDWLNLDIPKMKNAPITINQSVIAKIEKSMILLKRKSKVKRE